MIKKEFGMKNKVLGLVILTILCLTFIGCPNKGNGSINAKFEFRGERFNNTNSRSIMSLNNTDDNISALFDAFYDSLGNKIDSYTPSKFELGLSSISLYNDDDYNTIFHNKTNALVDFTKVGELQFKEVIPGTYTGVIFSFQYEKSLFIPWNEDSNLLYNEAAPWDPSITFTVQGGVGEGHIFASDEKYLYRKDGWENIWIVIDHIPDFDFSWFWDLKVNGDTYTISPIIIFPTGVQNVQETAVDQIWVPLHQLIFYSNKRMYFNGYPGGNYHNKSWGAYLGAPSWTHSGWSGERDTLVSPFAGITIPEDAATVRFVLYWDLEDIIERYDNNTPNDPSDDVYILAKGFWERLVLTAEIEY